MFFDVVTLFIILSIAPLSSYKYMWYAECRYKLCMCDSEAVQCFKKHEKEFNQKYRNYDQSKCTEGGSGEEEIESGEIEETAQNED